MKSFGRKDNKLTAYRTGFRRKKTTIEIAFRFLKTIFDRKAKIRKRIPQTKCVRELKIDLTVTSGNYKSKIT